MRLKAMYPVMTEKASDSLKLTLISFSDTAVFIIIRLSSGIVLGTLQSIKTNSPCKAIAISNSTQGNYRGEEWVAKESNSW